MEKSNSLQPIQPGLFSNPRAHSLAQFAVFLVAFPLYLEVALASEAPLPSGAIAGIVCVVVIGFISESLQAVSGPAVGLDVNVLSSIEKLAGFEYFYTCSGSFSDLSTNFGITSGRDCWFLLSLGSYQGLVGSHRHHDCLKQLCHTVGYENTIEVGKDWREMTHIGI